MFPEKISKQTIAKMMLSFIKCTLLSCFVIKTLANCVTNSPIDKKDYTTKTLKSLLRSIAKKFYSSNLHYL